MDPVDFEAHNLVHTCYLLVDNSIVYEESRSYWRSDLLNCFRWSGGPCTDSYRQSYRFISERLFILFWKLCFTASTGLSYLEGGRNRRKAGIDLRIHYWATTIL